MQVVVNSLLTEYSRLGKGKCLLVLHGWGDNSKGWHPMQTKLAEYFDVVIPDLPGFGGTEPPASAWSLNDYAAFVSSFVGKLKLHVYAVLAHSNGGAIAIRGIANGQLKTEKLILLDSAGIRNQYKGRTKLIRLITKTGKVMSAPLPSAAKKKLRRKVYKTVGSDMLVAEHLQETFKRVVTDDVQSDAAKLQLPTLIIYGEDDLAAPVSYGRLFHNLIAGSSFTVVSDAGHFVHIDKPNLVLESIKEFLK
jgi:pimeloyl-ACP methyl ester carboxylesterase